MMLARTARHGCVARAATPLCCIRVAPVARPVRLIAARGMAGSAEPENVDLSVFKGPTGVARTESLLEMGVLYAPGVPSPSESVNSVEPIKVHGLVARCDGGGGALGHPVEFIKLSRTGEPAVCKYCQLRFVSIGH